MKEKVIVAVVQLDIILFDLNKNLCRIEAAIKTARQRTNVDLIVFPELASIGYIKERDKNFGCKYMKCTEKISGKFTKALGEFAKKYGVYIISGMTEAHPNIPGTLYNAAILLNPNGKLVGVHRKTHIPGYEKHYFVPANTTDVFETDLGTIGIGICYENQFPELTRTYALKGAEILVMLWNMPSFSNGGTILHNITSIRAFENRMYAISCNRIGENNNIIFFGYSAIANPLGNLIASAESEDTIIYGVLDRDILLTERAQMPIFRDRRPDLYNELVKPL
jgi:predicted amidohydrolase